MLEKLQIIKLLRLVGQTPKFVDMLIEANYKLGLPGLDGLHDTLEPEYTI